VDMCKQHENPALHCLPGLSSVRWQHQSAPDQATARLGTCLPTCNRSSSLLAASSLLAPLVCSRPLAGQGRGRRRRGCPRQRRHTRGQHGHARGPSQRLVARGRA
jgi:hypothetical protein